MQVALNDENVSPLDATLESVMPGVHQRFVATDGHVKALHLQTQFWHPAIAMSFCTHSSAIRSHSYGKSI